MTLIEITGWREGANKVGAAKVLAHDADLGLATGKSLVDKVLDGRVSEFEVSDDQVADRIIAKLQDMGFDVQVKR